MSCRSHPGSFAELRAWLAKQLHMVSAKSKMADAIRYRLDHWERLTRFLDDGSVEIDRRALEPVAKRLDAGAEPAKT